MPIYEYECSACGHRMEAMQKIADAPLKKCPECAKMSLKKLISAAGFRLGGSGWYETDFKSSNKRNIAEKESGTSKSESSGASCGTSKGSCSSCA